MIEGIFEKLKAVNSERYLASTPHSFDGSAVSGGPKLHRSGGRKCHTWRSSSSGCEAPSVSSVS